MLPSRPPTPGTVPTSGLRGGAVSDGVGESGAVTFRLRSWQLQGWRIRFGLRLRLLRQERVWVVGRHLPPAERVEELGHNLFWSPTQPDGVGLAGVRRACGLAGTAWLLHVPPHCPGAVTAVAIGSVQ